MSVKSEEMRNIKFHQIPLDILRQKYGHLSEVEVAASIMEEVNELLTGKFMLTDTAFQPTSVLMTTNRILQGFWLLNYSREEKVLVPVPGYRLKFKYTFRKQNILFMTRLGHLFVLTNGSHYDLMQAYTCKEFPSLLSELGEKDIVKGWKVIPKVNQLYSSLAFVEMCSSSKTLKIKVGDGFVRFNLDERFQLLGIPELLNYFIEKCNLKKG